MSHFPKCVFFSLLILSSVFCSIPVMANITFLKFYAGQVNDVQRSPAFPIANNPFTLTYLHDPYRVNLTPYALNNGEYIRLFFVGGICKDGQVGINRYSARGELLETVQPGGHVYGLTPEGFLHDNDNNVGTFISMRPLNGDGLTYMPLTGPAPESCAVLEAYR